MSMRDFLQAEEARRAEEAAQLAHDARVKELSIHPFVKAGCDRNLREAYFCGLAYAGICDDFAIDDAERDLLATIGNALALDPEFMSETMARMSAAQNDNTVKSWAASVFFESLEVLRNFTFCWMPRLFAAEFARIRLIHPENESELAADFKDISRGVGSPVEDAQEAIAAVIKGGATVSMNNVDSLAVLLGDEAARYFVLRDMDLVDEPLAKFRADRAAAEAKRKEQEENRRTLPDRLAAIVESDDTWPVEFNPADYKPLFDAAGIADADAGPFVAVELLPYMKRACEAARAQINKAQIAHLEPFFWSVDHYFGARFEGVKEFRVLFRYAFFVDSFVDLNSLYKGYYFIGPRPSGSASAYCLFSLHDTDITSKKIGEERYQVVLRCLDSYPKALFDRLRTDGVIREEHETLYFVQWTELFSMIESVLAQNNSQSRYEIDNQKCKECSIFDRCLCADWCPTNAIKFEKNLSAIKCLIDQNLCRHCGVCVNRCYRHAIVSKED